MPNLIDMGEQAQAWLFGGGALLIVFAVIGFLFFPQLKSMQLAKSTRIGLALIGASLFFLAATADTTPELPISQGTPSPSPTLPGTPSPSPTLPGTPSPSPTLPGTSSPSPTLPGTSSPSSTFAHPQEVKLEGEEGTGAGEVMPRGAASQEQTIWLHEGESRSYQFDVLLGGQYRSIVVHYSNDSNGPLERVTLKVDKFLPVHFIAQDTGDYGNGWNVFKSATVKALGSPKLAPGTHSLSISVAGGDGYGIEIDYVQLMS